MLSLLVLFLLVRPSSSFLPVPFIHPMLSSVMRPTAVAAVARRTLLRSLATKPEAAAVLPEIVLPSNEDDEDLLKLR